MLQKLLKKLIGDKAANDIKAIQPQVDAVHTHEAAMRALTDDGLREASDALRQRIQDHIAPAVAEQNALRAEADAMSDDDLDAKEAKYEEVDALNEGVNAALEEVLDEILPEAFALVKETARRWSENKELRVKAGDWDRELAANRSNVVVEGEQAVWANTWKAAGADIEWNMVHYDVQLIGGIALHRGKVAEMQTGEGKTLVATLPVFLNALAGRGVHLVTVNDYLARRDSEWMGPLFEFHGMRVDCIDKHQPNSEERRKAYRADITYGTNNEFGFDYLRDNMAQRPDQLVQRPHHYAIVDEVDSVLIDEARTPLIISGPTPKGDVHEFEELKPKVVSLVNVQQKVVQGFLSEAKKVLSDEGAPKDAAQAASLSLFRAYRGLPKSKALIKFLSNDGMKQQLLKTEGYYLQDNKRAMPEADAELYFVIDEKHKSVELTEKGIEYLTRNMEDDTFFTMPDLATELVAIDNAGLSDDERTERKAALMQDYNVKSARIHTMNQLLKSYTLFEKDVDYVVMENKVMIVDEQTGRIMDGRRYSDGLHQAIEAKESVKVEAATQTYATVTLQNYFRMYNKLSGMTGTAETEAGELWDIYKLDVMVIPTNRPIARKDEQDLVYKTKREKYNAIIDDVVKLSEAGRPVLVGTTTVEVSELLSKMLNLRGIQHQVLNAKMHQQEAEIVARAGQRGAVTIATNMAGRGTDIKLKPEVKELGGLAIIGTERHDSRRVDRQLRGRSGRQGDPGSSQFYVSLEDDLMRLFSSDRVAKMMDRMGHKEGEVIQHSMITKSIERAQKKVEENNFGVRKRLLEYDDVMNAQREVIYKRRRHALHGDRIRTDIANMFYELVETHVMAHQPTKDFEGFQRAMLSDFGMESPVEEGKFGAMAPADLALETFLHAERTYREKFDLLAERAHPVIERVHNDASNNYTSILVPFTDGLKTLQVAANIEESVASRGRTVLEGLEKSVVLAVIDQYWKEQLRAMDDLRSNVQNARYEQKDPLVIYKMESFRLFEVMVGQMNTDVASFLMQATIPTGPAPQQAPERPAVDPVIAAGNVQISKPGVQNIQQQAMAAAQAAALRAQQQQMQQRAAAGQPAAPAPKQAPIRSEKKALPNDPCPCGSGKKYKKCHGA